LWRSFDFGCGRHDISLAPLFLAIITKSQKEYEDLAIELATNQEKFRKIKAKLISNRSTKPLFNTLLFTQKLEDSYIKMYERYRMNLSPDNLIID
jgi:PhoPQ-activated pathogenicity-related protein